MCNIAQEQHASNVSYRMSSFLFFCVCCTVCTPVHIICCNILQQNTTHCNTHKYTQTHCSTLDMYLRIRVDTIHCNTLQLTATHCNSFKCTAAIPSTYTAGYVWTGHAAAHCNSLQLTVTHCIMHIYRKRVDIILPKRAMFAPSIWRDVVGISYHQDPKAKTLPFRL